MTDRTYKLNQWYPWTGGKCPVPDETEVKFLHQEGFQGDGKASSLYWNRGSGSPGESGIIAFCVTEYPDEVVTEERIVKIGDTMGEYFRETCFNATCTYRNSKLVEVHWKDESDE